MVSRCTRPENQNYRYYGGRGITISNRWRLFANFLEDMGERPSGTSLDRIDPDGNYELSNCRWANAQEQRASRGPFHTGHSPLLIAQILGLRGRKRTREVGAILGIGQATVSQIWRRYL